MQNGKGTRHQTSGRPEDLSLDALLMAGLSEEGTVALQEGPAALSVDSAALSDEEIEAMADEAMTDEIGDGITFIPAARGPRRKRNKMERKENIIAFLFILPPVAGFLIFTLLSVIFTLIYSFHDYRVLMDTMEYVGVQNFSTLFTNVLMAPKFGRAITNTLILLLSTPISMILGLVIAGLLRLGEVKGKKVFQVLYYLPAVSSGVALNIVWRYIFNAEYGLLNGLLGINVNWLGNDHLLRATIIFKNSINAMGGAMILYLAGMLNVPNDLYEASELDGAGKIRQFFSITLPVISPVTFYLLITGVIGGLQSYVDADVFASGDAAAQTIVYFIWQQGLAGGSTKYGVACAASVLLALAIMVVTIVQFKLSNKWVYEE